MGILAQGLPAFVLLGKLTKAFEAAVSCLPAAMSDDEPTFDSADSGASATYPQQAGEIRKGSHLMIKGKPCKCIEVSTSKTGKHGHAKAHIVALDIFTSKKNEDLCPCSHNLEIPFVNKVEYTVLSYGEEGDISLLQEDGNTKDDLNMPDIPMPNQGEPSDEDKKLAAEIRKEVDKGEKTVVAIVQGACDMEKIIAIKLT